MSTKRLVELTESQIELLVLHLAGKELQLEMELDGCEEHLRHAMTASDREAYEEELEWLKEYIKKVRGVSVALRAATVKEVS
jgi:hypothetical protein